MYSSHVLQEGTILNEKYRIESVLGEGGFGIAYLATDININETVAIKEFFPSTLGTRNVSKSMDMSITIISEKYQEMYDKGLARFREEAMRLAKFNNEPGIVSVKNYFEENNTGYMVMEFIEGINLKQYLKKNGGKIPYSEAIELLIPIMNSLSVVHKAGIIHRDISPDNIMITKAGMAKLIDFGAARSFDNEEERSMSVILKNGYAPLEQYSLKGEQGPATDVYALAATLYKMITGETPLEPTARIEEGKKNIKVKNVPNTVNKALNKGMKLNADDRYKSVEEFYKAITKKEKNYVWMLSLLVDVAVIIVALMYSKHLGKTPYKISGFEAAELKTSVSDENISLSEMEELYACAYAPIMPGTGLPDKKITSCETGEVLYYVEEYGDWVLVRNSEGTEGYIESKYVCHKDEYDGWLKLLNQIADASDNSELDFTKANFPGFYMDFDGNGEKELIAPIYTGNSGLWYANKDTSVRVSEVPESSEVFQQGKDWYLCAKYITANKFTTDYYYVCDGMIQKIDTNGMIVSNILGYTAAFTINYNMPVKFITTSGNIKELAMEGKRYWPIMVKDGQIGECESCEITKKEFYKLSGAKLFEKNLFKKVHENFIMIPWTYPIGINARAITLDSVYYNDVGIIILNYILDYDAEVLPGVVSFMTYNGDCKRAYIYAVVKLGDNSFNIETDLKDMGWGEMRNSSGTLPIIVKSDFSHYSEK